MIRSSVIWNSDHHTKDKISNLRMRPCSVQLHDILDFKYTDQHCRISKCRPKNCKTCNILTTDAHFTSNFTNKNYFTRSYDDVNRKSANMVYELECNLCGLVYIGKWKVNNTNEHAVIDPVSLTMLMILLTSVLINLAIRIFQCEFVSSKKYTIGLAIQT